jgi:hypothetical protein
MARIGREIRVDDKCAEKAAGVIVAEKGRKKLIEYAIFGLHGLSPGFCYLRCSNAGTS